MFAHRTRLAFLWDKKLLTATSSQPQPKKLINLPLQAGIMQIGDAGEASNRPGVLTDRCAFTRAGPTLACAQCDAGAYWIFKK